LRFYSPIGCSKLSRHPIFRFTRLEHRRDCIIE
jgi:hypothetical protein